MKSVLGPGITKSIIYPGKTNICANENEISKATFHFRTIHVKENGEEVVIDDSKKAGKPMELILNKKFKMPVWETCIKSMFVGEVSKFEVEKELVYPYPIVSQSYRQYSGQAPKAPIPTHCCGMMAKHGLGFDDLDSLFHKPTDLTFIIELLNFEQEGTYEKASWILEPSEKLESVPHLKDEGNRLYKEGKISEASKKYEEALQFLEQLTLMEKPGDEEWQALEQKKLPLLLNFSQCKLHQGDYYAAIVHATSALEKDPDNVKALYRRGKAHIGAWNPEQAREDLTRAKELDPKLTRVVDEELKKLEEAIKEKLEQDRQQFQGKLFSQ